MARGWLAWRCAVGNRKRVAHPAKRIVRRRSNRFLGTRFHPDHVPADFDLAVARNPESARTHMGLFDFLGFAGSAVGTIFFTLALKYGNPTVVNVVLNIQPVISTLGAFFLFGDRLARRSSFTLGSQSSQACLYRLRIRLRSEFHLSARS
jgi:hypothetical protein